MQLFVKHSFNECSLNIDLLERFVLIKGQISFFVGSVVVGASETVDVVLVAVSTLVTVKYIKKGNVEK